jgi:hypothetical protein
LRRQVHNAKNSPKKLAQKRVARKISRRGEISSGYGNRAY